MSVPSHALRPVGGAPLRVTLAAAQRSTLSVLRSPALLITPVAQSLFFLLIYAGQLGAVGSSYLAGGSFISFLLPLILLTGVATGAGAAGTLVLGDVSSGYMDRLRLAYGTSGPFLAGAAAAALLTVALQTMITIAGAALIGYRPGTWSGAAGMVALMLVLGVGIALLSMAVAIRTSSAGSTNLVTLAVFGMSFFTGVFAPVDQLAPWMQPVAALNPLSYIIDAARQLEAGVTVSALPIAAGVLVTLLIAGAAACALAQNHVRRNR